MKRFRASPAKWIAMLVGVTILCGMGAWQLERREWKRQLLATIAERQAMPPLTGIPIGADYNQFDYRRAVLTGLVDESKTVYLGPRTFREQAGYHLLAPMFLADGKVVLINEGFVPAEWAAHQYTPAHVQTLSGTLRLPPLPGPFTPVNPPVYDLRNGNKYFWVDLLAIGNALNTPHLLPVLFELDRTGDLYPVGGQGMTDIPNDHLQYALTWFALALALFSIFLLSSLRREGGQNRDTLYQRKESGGTGGGPSSLW